MVESPDSSLHTRYTKSKASLTGGGEGCAGSRTGGNEGHVGERQWGCAGVQWGASMQGRAAGRMRLGTPRHAHAPQACPPSPGSQ